MDYLAILKNMDSASKSGELKAGSTTLDQQIVPESYCETSELGEKSPSPECGPECCEVISDETGLPAKVHQPWTGECRAKFQAPTVRQVQAVCWHCSGAARCSCISCADGLAAGEKGECLICRGSGRATAWVQ